MKAVPIFHYIFIIIYFYIFRKGCEERQLRDLIFNFIELIKMLLFQKLLCQALFLELHHGIVLKGVKCVFFLPARKLFQLFLSQCLTVCSDFFFFLDLDKNAMTEESIDGT